MRCISSTPRRWPTRRTARSARRSCRANWNHGRRSPSAGWPSGSLSAPCRSRGAPTPGTGRPRRTHGPRTVQVVDFDDRSVAEIRLAEGALRVVAATLAATNATAGGARPHEERCSTPATARSPASEALDPDGTSLTSADLAGILRITREFHAELNAGCNNPVVLRLLRMVDASQPRRPCRATCPPR